MYKFIYMILLVVALPTSSQALDKNGNFSSKAEQDTYIADTLKEMAVQMNSQVPMMVDAETQMSNVLALDKTINFTYRLVNTNSKEINVSEFQKMVKANLNDLVCKSKATQTLIDLGVNYVYIYFGNDGRLVTRFTIKNYHCK